MFVRLICAFCVLTPVVKAAAFSNAAMAAAQQKRNASVPAAASAAHAMPMISSAKEADDAHKLFVFNVSNVIGGSESSEVFEMDIGAKTFERKFTGIDSRFSFVSASVVCGGMLTAVATEAPVDAGLISINMSSGQHTYVSTLTDNYLVHALHCASASELKLIVSESGDKPIFSLRSFNLGTKTSTVIGTFPEDVLWGGWDTIFTFRGNEVWGTFPIFRDPVKVRTGELLIMDVATGAIKSRKNFPEVGGQPYYVLPTMADGTFQGIFHEPSGTLRSCACDPSGAEITCGGCTDAGLFWNVGVPPPVCAADQAVHVASRAAASPASQPVYLADATSGALSHVIDINIANDYRIGTMTCIA